MNLCVNHKKALRHSIVLAKAHLRWLVSQWVGLWMLHHNVVLESHMVSRSYERFPPVTGYTRRTIAYDFKANRFIKCANLKERRMHHSATVLNNKFYVTGGRYISSHDVIVDSDSFDCYDPKTDTWTSKGSLPYKLFDHGCLTLTCVSQTWAKS